MDRYGQYVKAPKAAFARSVDRWWRSNTTKRPLRRPTGEPNIDGDWAPEQVVMADPRGTGGGMVPLGTAERVQAGRAARSRRWRRRWARGGGAAAGPRLYGGTELHRARERRPRVRRANRQSPLPLRDHEHHLRLDVRWSRQPHHAEQGHHRPPVRADGAEADDLHEREAAPGQRSNRLARDTPSAAGTATSWSSIRSVSCRAC